MAKTLLGYLVVISACAAPAASVDVDPDEAPAGDGKADAATGLPDITCTDAPDAGPQESLRHLHNHLVVDLGDPHHRGFDLVANAASDTQRIEGDISYGLIDKALEDEDVDVFACRRSVWRNIGRARTDDEGHFVIELTGTHRLPVGMRDMYASVAGDRSGVRFLAVVATDATELAISDVDGTLTSSENAFAANIIGIDASIHAGAATGWQHIAATGRIPVYVTARAALFTQDTRDWLSSKDMPRGALRLAPSVLLPGSATVDYKSRTFARLADELPIALGVGNRASDIDAYTSVGLAGDRIFIKLPEFEGEVADRIAAGDATGFDTYPGPLSGF